MKSVFVFIAVLVLFVSGSSMASPSEKAAAPQEKTNTTLADDKWTGVTKKSRDAVDRKNITSLPAVGYGRENVLTPTKKSSPSKFIFTNPGFKCTGVRSSGFGSYGSGCVWN